MKLFFAVILMAVAMFWLVPDAKGDGAKTLYTCGMHPQVIQDHPGNCPICGMKLTPIHDHSAGAPMGERKVKYYKSTMKPGETSSTPSKDSMGMDMVPVYEEGGADETSAIAVDAATMQDMNVRTAAVQTGPLRKSIRTVGTIDYNETALVDVTTKFKGWIEKLNVDANGQLVHRGDAMFEVYSPELYSAEVEYLQALSLATTNDPATAALREAAEDKLRFFDVPEAQIAELGETHRALKALPIATPASGFVIEKNVVQGQMVEAGARLYRIADLGIVWVIAEVYEQDLPFLKLGQEAVVEVSSLPDQEFRGRVTYVYPSVDEKTRTAKVRLEFENPGFFLKPGMFVSAEIHAELDHSAVLVPDSAVLRSGAKNTVFIALPGGKFEARDVVLGVEAENGMNEVVSGLKAGEQVVTSGQFLLDSESQLREAIEKMRGPTAPVSGEASPPVVTNEAPAVATNMAEAEPIVYVCPMPEHVSIIYHHAGECPICGMELVPVTPADLQKIQPGGKVLYYTCPMPEHGSVHEDKPGKCPLCAMTLIPVMAPPEAVTNAASSDGATKSAAKKLYYCPMHPEVVSDEPGTCPKCGMDLVPKPKEAGQ